jgi:hypothetical protein
MWFDPDENPRAFVTALVAMALLVFHRSAPFASEAWKKADEFVAEAEKRYGKLSK